jgi:hypothetical protein
MKNIRAKLFIMLRNRQFAELTQGSTRPEVSDTEASYVDSTVGYVTLPVNFSPPVLFDFQNCHCHFFACISISSR